MEPVIAGLEKDGTPFIASTDLIGCINFAKDFVVSGTASNMMYGMCESLWEPDLVTFVFLASFHTFHCNRNLKIYLKLYLKLCLMLLIEMPHQVGVLSFMLSQKTRLLPVIYVEDKTDLYD